MKTSEVLNLAADKIQERGWTWGPQGWPSSEYADDSPLCLEGGIIAALGIDSTDYPKIKEEFQACPAYVAVREYLNWKGDLWLWNDNPSHDGGEVIEVLRAAAAIEESRETSEVLLDAVA